jgi:DNA polymerase (family X)
VDMKAVIDACALAGTAIELNSHPYRLDLDWQWLPYATQRGVHTSINPDAHKTGGLDDMRWGVRVGRKGLLTAHNTMNALSATELAAYFSTRRAKALA